MLYVHIHYLLDFVAENNVQNADIIAVFQNGKVVEKGSHNQPMTKQESRIVPCL